MCSVSNDFMEKIRSQSEKYIRRVFGVSEQFVGDFLGVVECLKGDAHEYLAGGLVSGTAAFAFSWNATNSDQFHSSDRPTG